MRVGPNGDAPTLRTNKAKEARTMSKKHTRDLRQFTQEKRSAPWMVVPWGDAAELEIPSAAFWPKRARQVAQQGENAESLRIICGDDFDRFVEITEEDDEVIASLIWELIVEEMGVPLGQGSTSSTS